MSDAMGVSAAGVSREMKRALLVLLVLVVAVGLNAPSILEQQREKAYRVHCVVRDGSGVLIDSPYCDHEKGERVRP